MNLAPNLPDTPTMQQLLQLLHEEIGLPERKTISLTTSINFDLGCNGADAQHLIEALEEQFGIDFVDFDSYRYFQPEGYDVFLKRKAKGRGDKEPLTIGMLYRAIKAQRWDTRSWKTCSVAAPNNKDIAWTY
jgi:acyl carrier protein